MSSRWKFRPPPKRGAKGAPRDWVLAKPNAIERALRHALAKPTGGWFALDSTRRLLRSRRPRAYRVAGRSLVTWRSGQDVVVAPNKCPHMGAALDPGRVCDGAIVCPWHGLALGPGGHGAWRPLTTHDDGVLTWVRLDAEDASLGPDPMPSPPLCERPARFIDAVIRVEAGCDPEDVLANRLDPWHGAHLHPYSFGGLEVLDETDDKLTVRVEKRIFGPVRVEVDASFHCPSARSIVMTIVDGEGRGSVVETHATPIEPGRTAIVEATLASSDRPGFRHAVRLARCIRPFIERSARRLWVDDAAYAERLYELRHGAETQGSTTVQRTRAV